MKKLAAASIAALMCAGTLAGCGGGSSDDSSADGYCDDVKAAKTQFQGMANSAFSSNFTQLYTAVQTISAEAPDDIKPSWSALSDSLDSLKSALDEAGLSMADLDKMQSGDASAIDPAKLATFMKAAESFSAQSLDDDSAKITAEVKKECGIDMESGS